MEYKMVTIPFDLETAKKINIGERVGQIVTEKGRNRAEIVYEDNSSICPLLVVIHSISVSADWFSATGKAFSSENRLLLEVPEYTTFKDGDVLSNEKGKLNFIRYSEMKNWSVRELFGEDLGQADRALINKVYHMLFDIGSDFESVIRMLYSFRNGPKSGIKVADPEDNYEWTNKDGNEKYSTKNLPKAHFRWDWRRYTLSKESVDKITEFVDTILES